jgi:hypothetical protein
MMVHDGAWWCMVVHDLLPSKQMVDQSELEKDRNILNGVAGPREPHPLPLLIYIYYS